MCSWCLVGSLLSSCPLSGFADCFFDDALGGLWHAVGTLAVRAVVHQQMSLSADGAIGTVACQIIAAFRRAKMSPFGMRMLTFLSPLCIPRTWLLLLRYRRARALRRAMILRTHLALYLLPFGSAKTSFCCSARFFVSASKRSMNCRSSRTKYTLRIISGGMGGHATLRRGLLCVRAAGIGPRGSGGRDGFARVRLHGACSGD